MFLNFRSSNPGSGSGFAIRKNAGSGSVSGSALNQCGSETLPLTVSSSVHTLAQVKAWTGIVAAVVSSWCRNYCFISQLEYCRIEYQMYGHCSPVFSEKGPIDQTMISRSPGPFAGQMTQNSWKNGIRILKGRPKGVFSVYINPHRS